MRHVKRNLSLDILGDVMVGSTSKAIIVPHRIIRSWYTGCWCGCYIWYSEEGPGRAAAPPSPLLAVPNVTAHPSTASVPITVLLYDGPFLCGFNVAIKGLKVLKFRAAFTIRSVMTIDRLTSHVWCGLTNTTCLSRSWRWRCLSVVQTTTTTTTSCDDATISLSTTPALTLSSPTPLCSCSTRLTPLSDVCPPLETTQTLGFSSLWHTKPPFSAKFNSCSACSRSRQRSYILRRSVSKCSYSCCSTLKSL